MEQEKDKNENIWQRVCCLDRVRVFRVHCQNVSLMCKVGGLVSAFLGMWSWWWFLPIVAVWLLDATVSQRDRWYLAMETDVKYSDEPRLSEFSFDPENYRDTTGGILFFLLGTVECGYYGLLLMVTLLIGG